ncbi:MAG: hypothetical protein D6731_22780 [Planctomycetota bacterium]|nr:MAG: hypothetical protein D6731_22780 [Planctomycetota bacterium]
MAPRFEIGVVYKKGSRYGLAVSESTLLTFRDGEPQEFRPQAKYDVVRSISVETLCALWGIDLATLDEHTAKYLAPTDLPVRTRPRGSRRRAAAEELAWRDFRMVRLRAG